MEIRGTIYEIGQVTQVTETVKKIDFVVEYIENPQYPEYLKFEAIQARADLLNEVAVGDEVEVFFNLRGRPWTDKTGKKTYFNSLQMWKINVTKQSGGDSSPQYSAPADISSAPDDDDLPF